MHPPPVPAGRSSCRERQAIPELPDVQVFKEYVDATALHRTIEHAYVPDGRELTDVSQGTVRRHLTGRVLESTHRHGKHLFIELHGDARWLRLHFGMTGTLHAWEGDGQDDVEHTRLRLDFEDGWHLAYLCPRRFGQIGIVDDPESFVERDDLGPDLRSVAEDRSRFREIFAGRRGSVKGALTNQHAAAGLGNVYADEVLFYARIHPETAATDLEDDAWDHVRRAVRHVIERAIEARAEPERMPSSWLIHCREEGAPCPRCGAPIAKLSVSGRSTYLCTAEQPRRDST